MRKTIIALIMILPLLFVFVIFSAVNVVSIQVNVSANNIRIVREEIDGLDENDILQLDMAEHQNHFVTARVEPDNATNAKYTLSSDNPAAVDVDESGKILVNREGSAKITATSNDGNYTDSITVVATSSKPYDFSFSLSAEEDGEDLLLYEDNAYTSSVSTGYYYYNLKTQPDNLPADAEISCVSNGNVIIDEVSKKILLPFSGTSIMNVTMHGGVDGDIEKEVRLTVKRPSSSGRKILINGVETNNTVFLDSDAQTASFYVEAYDDPVFEENENYSVEVVKVGANRYRADVTFAVADGQRENLYIGFTAGSESAEVTFTFLPFDFTVRSDLPYSVKEGEITASVLRGSAAKFYAVELVSTQNITYEWSTSSSHVTLEGSDTPVCTVTASSDEGFVLTVKALRGGTVIMQKDISVSVTMRLSAVQVAGIPKTDLAQRFTIGGKKYADDSLTALTDVTYALNVKTYGTSGRVEGLNELNYTVSDSSKAEIGKNESGYYVIPKGVGEVKISFEWKGNAAFKSNVNTSVTLNVVADGVEVTTSDELYKATDAGYKVVLKDDIMLGSNPDGTMKSDDVLYNLLKDRHFTSTYNTEWYKEAVKTETNVGEPLINYAMEFKNDVYGNGHYINADYLTNAEGSKIETFFRGPIYFVKYKEMASVAGQDNCAFLIRTPNVKLYGLTLMGCSDEALEQDGKYELNKLNEIGTTLEVNASADIVNCRVRNGRNVVRAYGGNTDGQNYFIGQLSNNTGCDSERIKVRIEGSILSQGREFILKIGANRALRSTADIAEPPLTDASGRPYTTSDGKSSSNNYNLLHDDYFYKNYVMTDVTLKDSVLETSGLFSVGVESNFAGTMLTPGYNGSYKLFTTSWVRSGGTSFASVLRLEGDVRIYDWKDLANIDSSTLIESPTDALNEWLKLDINGMFNHVYSTNPEKYSNIIYEEGGKRYAHGGIAFYGGGLNYSQIDLENFNPDISDLRQFNINISILSTVTDNASMKQQGDLLPQAAGTQDFRFYLYGADSKNFSYQRQVNDNEKGLKYSGIQALNIL